MDIVTDDGTANYLNSTLRERIVEHLFVGKALQWLWNRNPRVTDVEVLRSEFDAGGYDLVMSYKKIVMAFSSICLLRGSSSGLLYEAPLACGGLHG